MNNKIISLKHLIIGGILFLISFLNIDLLIWINSGLSHISIYYLVWIFLLLALKGVFCREEKIFTNFSIKLFLWYMLLVTGLVLLNELIEYLLRFPEEPTMAIYKRRVSLHITNADVLSFILPTILFPPIKEELTFRFFLLSGINYKLNKYTELSSVIITAFLFSLAHFWVYRYFTTFVWLFIIGAVYAHARIKSNSIILPMLLHSYTIILMLAIQQLM